MTHYYTNNLDLESNPQQFIYKYQGNNFLFTSDQGVFSKKMIDYGSQVLLNNFFKTEEKTLLDVGCGYGTFGICFKKVYPELQIEMIDVNERALALAKDNAKNNQVIVNIFKSDVYEKVNKTYDIIVTNPPVRAGKKVVIEILEGAYQHLNENGSLWVILQKKQGAPSAKKKMLAVFNNCEIIKRDKGYYLLRSLKK